jgi:hypothetical protein
MRLIVGFFLSWFYSIAFAQSFSGIIFSADTKQPVPFASVYLSNTSVGTTSNAQGKFVINNFPEGRYDLIVSCMGYEPYQTTIQSNKLNEIEIFLKPRVQELKEVVVQSYEKDGWSKWGKFFLDCFIGHSAYAANCTIKNTEAIKFRYDKKGRILAAFANEPLIIVNESLGYEIKYDLVNFEYNQTKSLLFYSGYPFFTPIETTKKGKQNRWEKKRLNAYEGSMMHFMRALYRNKIADEKFEMRKLIKVPNDEKKRIQAIVSNKIKVNVASGKSTIRIGSSGSFNTGENEFSDSSIYYNRILGEPDEKSILINQLLSGDSIAYAHDSTTAALYFTDYLQIIYRGKSEPTEYAKEQMRLDVYKFQESTIQLINNRPVYVTSNGMYHSGTDILSTGFWGWNEKMATMLPFDYKPPKK